MPESPDYLTRQAGEITGTQRQTEITGAQSVGNQVASPAFAEIAAYTARQLQIPQVTSGVTTTAVRAETAVTTTTTTPAPESQDG